MGRISVPLLDRMDLSVTVPRARIEDLQSTGGKEENSEAVRSRVMDACERQQYRFRGTDLRFNSDMGAADLEKFCLLGEKEKGCLRDLFEAEAMSVRAYHRIIRVARTIADLEGAERIREEHIYLAYTYRQGDLLQFKR